MALVFGCTNAKEIAEEFCREYPEFKLGESELEPFPDGETKHVLYTDPKGKNVVIIQTGLPNSLINLMEASQAANAAKHFGAKTVTVVFTYLPYGRQDKYGFSNDKGLQPKTLHIALKMIKYSGADTLVVLDAHFADKFGKFSKCKMNIINEPVGLEMVKHMNDFYQIPYNNMVLLAPDLGARPRVKQVVDELKKENIVVEMQTVKDKKRIDSENVEVKFYKDTNVEGKDVLILDDMICTGGTMIAVGKTLKKDWKAKSVHAVATHGIFATKKHGLSDPTILQKMRNGFDSCVVTNSIKTPVSEVTILPALLRGIKEANK
ncbi:MAG: ribose-phosphate diphosphokinase [Candidatus Undinarchaeales archaeon]|nr:ribose-phosphate diphosphokinase [Candidatus Undinarchaeales archaeon]